MLRMTTVVVRYIKPHITANSKDRGAITIRNVAIELFRVLIARGTSLFVGQIGSYMYGIMKLARVGRTGSHSHIAKRSSTASLACPGDH